MLVRLVGGRSVTDAVMGEVTAWQARPLEAMYPVVFFDALRVKIREEAVVRNITANHGRSVRE
jgi:transposase-like protein